MNTISRFYVSGIENDQDVETLHTITRDFFGACTILHGEGFWDNTKEDTYIIEVASGTNIDPSVRRKKEYAHCLATQFGQDCVMLLEYEATVQFLYPEGEEPIKGDPQRGEKVRPNYLLSHTNQGV